MSNVEGRIKWIKELKNFKGVVIYESFSGINEVTLCFSAVDQPLAKLAWEYQ